jgi:hypothetical protein
MGLDKLRCITPRRPGNAWFDMLNVEFKQPKDQRSLVFNFQFKDRKNVGAIDMTSRVRIHTKPGIEPAFFLELNYIAPGGKLPPLSVWEINPNKFDQGWAGVERMRLQIFTDDCLDLKVTRMDLNAEIEGVSVHYFRDALRIPLKRKSADCAKERDREEWKSCGVQTLYIGRSPSRLRIYDKIQELKYRGIGLRGLPDVLTRFEWELRNDRCPIEHFADIRRLLPDCDPFAAIQLKDASEYYDYKNDPHGSMKRRLFKGLVEDLGIHDAIKVFNRDRNFARDFRPIVVDNTDLKQQIGESYQRTNRRLLSNRGADIPHLYRRCASCDQEVVLSRCPGCCVRVCRKCQELGHGHEKACPNAAAQK